MIVAAVVRCVCKLTNDELGEALRDLSLSLVESAADLVDGSAPKIRCRAAWYCASRSAYDFCCESDRAEDEADVDRVGRFSIRRAGLKAAGGGATDAAVLEDETTSSGIGALLFLHQFRCRVRSMCM